MALVLEILLGVAILASFFIAYMSAKTWQVYQVVLVVFIFLANVAFFYLAARTLATHNAWRTAYNRLETELTSVDQQLGELKEGGPRDEQGQADPKGIRQLSLELQKLAQDRGGVVRDATVEGVKDGTIQLALKTADHGLVPNTIVFVFDQTPYEEGGRYRGEFKVVGVGDDATKVQLAPNLPLTADEAKRLADVRGTLALYTKMPIDNAELFAALDDATRAMLLPESVRAEFADAKRKLRDYDQAFHENYVQRQLIADAIAELENNIARMKAATAEAEKEAGYRQTEKTALAGDLDRFQYEQKVIAQYQESLAATFRQLADRLKATYLENRRLAGELTARQLDAAREIDRRTEAAAASVGTAP